MTAPQLSDPGISGEWIRGVEHSERPDAAARRLRFQRLVTYTMVGLTAFAALGLGCFAWRKHSLQAALEAPVPPALVSAPVDSLAPASASPEPAAPSSEAGPVPAPASPPLAALAAPAALKTKTLSSSKSSKSKKKPVDSPFLRSVKPAAKSSTKPVATRPR